jgi:TRAP-type mannitol/chloroaromatic compound transport system permease small subunit
MSLEPGVTTQQPLLQLIVAFQRSVDRLALLAAYVASFCLLAIVLMVLTEVALGLFSKYIPGVPGGLRFAWEYSAYLMGCTFMFGGALSLRAGMQIRVELLLRAGGGRLRRPIEIVASILGALFLCTLAWSLVRFAWQSWNSSQVSTDTFTPLWIPQGALALATIVFALQAVARVLNSLADLPLEREMLKVASASE